MGVFFWLISGQTAISFVPGPSIHTGLYATFLEVKKRPRYIVRNVLSSNEKIIKNFFDSKDKNDES